MTNEQRNADPVNSETAYDDAFKTMQGECDDLVIPFVNHMFGEHYDRTAVIRRLNDEHHTEDLDGTDMKRITDSRFDIVFENVVRRYHMECESKKYDGTILVRIFEYDALVAREDAQKSTDCIRVRFPRTGVLVLRSSGNTPDKARIEMELPGGQCPSYDIAIVKVSDYSIDDIFEKKLYMLIPFYAFTFENRLDELNNSEEKLATFIDLYNGIFDRLRHEQESGNLSELSYSVIIRLTHSVVYKLTMKRQNVQKKVGEFMGGKVLDLPEIRIYKKGLAEGEAKGEAKGAEERRRLESENKRLREELEKLREAQTTARNLV